MKTLALVCAMALGAVGCATTEDDPDETDRAPQASLDNLDVPALQLSTAAGGGGGGTHSCDDFDSYCDATHTCAAGFTCALNTSHCGANYFGTYPSCGVTATCYPACQPK